MAMGQAAAAGARFIAPAVGRDQSRPCKSEADPVRQEGGRGILNTEAPGATWAGAGRKPSVISKELLEILVCPACRGELDYEPDVRLTCRGCGRSYPIRDGIPIMLVDAEGTEPPGGADDA